MGTGWRKWVNESGQADETCEQTARRRIEEESEGEEIKSERVSEGKGEKKERVGG